MLKTLQSGWNQDKDFPGRTFTIQCRQRVLNGTMYEELKHAFADEKDGSGQYVPLANRRPSVRSSLCRSVVDDSVSLLFSEGHFPAVEIANEDQKEALQKVLKEARLNETMLDAATRGSVGSVAILFRVLSKRVFFKVLDTAFLTPNWDPKAPDTLISVTEKYKVSGANLKASGYTIGTDETNTEFWFQRVWDTNEEVWFIPQPVSKTDGDNPLKRDNDKSVKHDLGFVPVVWIKNLPGGDDVDGLCTFPDEAVETQIEIDYQLSQGGRGLKYTSDPTLLIKEPAFGERGGGTVKGAANALIVSDKGDAKLLEISGDGAAAVLDYVKHLREVALETMHGNRTSPEKMSSAQSGRAMELMNQALVWLADRLRISYGENAIIELVSMIARSTGKIKLELKNGDKVGDIDPKLPATLRWPAWYAPTAHDRNETAQTLRTHTDAGHMSNETALKTIAADYDVEDIPAEMALIAKEMAERNANVDKKQVNITE